MGSYKFIFVFLVVAIIAIGIAGAVAVIRQQGFEQEKKIIDDLIFGVAGIVYEYYLLPTSSGGFGKSVSYMYEHQDRLILLLPSYDSAMKEILTTEDGFEQKGFQFKIWPNYWQRFAIGVKSKTYGLERWILVQCASGKMELSNDAPVSNDFITN